jgi:hypothetical protein
MPALVIYIPTQGFLKYKKFPIVTHKAIQGTTSERFWFLSACGIHGTLNAFHRFPFHQNI